MPETIKCWVETAPAEYTALGFTHCAMQETTVPAPEDAPEDAPAPAPVNRLIALFTSGDDAREFRYNKTATPEDLVSRAESVMRADYYSDVRNTASGIQDELLGRVKDGEYGEALREWLVEHIDETIDSASCVIYTGQAMDCLRYSDNDGAYVEEFGTDGIVEDGAINWSRLAYGAFGADVREQLEALGVDLNSPVPDCDKCGSDDQDEARKEVPGHDGLLCQTCADEIEDAPEDAPEDMPEAE